MDNSSLDRIKQLSESAASRRTLLRRTAVGLGGATFLPLLAAGGGDAAAEETPSDAEGVFGGRMTVALAAGAIPTLDIQTSSNTYARIIGNHMYETLLAYGEDYTVVPRLAASWEMSEDGTVCTLQLRDDVIFHNGEKMIADDVIASIDRYMEHGARGILPDFVESASAVDDYTVEINMIGPEFRFIDLLASPSIGLHILPKAIIEGKAVEELGREEYIGTGPFKLEEFTAGDEVLMSRFDGYYEPEGQRNGYGGAKTAYFDELRWIVVPESGARISGLLAGDYDYVQDVPSAERPRLTEDSGVSTTIAGAAFWWSLAFNAKEGAGISTNLEFRRAVQARADMQQVADLIAGGDPDLYLLQPSIYQTEQDQWWTEAGGELFNMNNPELAKDLLEQSGYDGEEFIIAYNPAQTPHNGIAQGMAAQLREIGVTVNLLAMDAAALDDLLDTGEGWHATPDLFSIRFSPLDWLGTFGCSTARRFWCDEEFDAAAEELRATPDEEKQKALSDEMQRVWYEDANWIKGPDIFDARGIAADIEGYEPWYLERFWGVWRK